MILQKTVSTKLACLFHRQHFVFLRFIYSKAAIVQKSNARIESPYQQRNFASRYT